MGGLYYGLPGHLDQDTRVPGELFQMFGGFGDIVAGVPARYDIDDESGKR